MPSPWSRTKYVSSALHARSPTCTIASRQTQLANISVAHGLVSFARIRRIPDSNQQPRTKTSAAWRGPRWLRLNAKIETEAIAFLLVSYAVFCWLPLPLFFFLSLSLSDSHFSPNMAVLCKLCLWGVHKGDPIKKRTCLAFLSNHLSKRKCCFQTALWMVLTFCLCPSYGP